MKKYIKPAIICTEMECMQMIAATIELSKEKATNDACAKKFDVDTSSLWDEEDE